MDTPASTVTLFGKTMPFTPEQMIKILKVVKRSVEKMDEEMSAEDEKAVADDLLNDLNNL